MIACLALILDLVTKWVVASAVSPIDFAAPYPFGGVSLIQVTGFYTCLNYVGNRGVAFGWMQGWGLWLLVFRMLVVLGLCYGYRAQTSLPRKISLSLLIAGAFGNILDSWWNGYVVDFIHIGIGGVSMPIFNLADTWICLGVLGLIVMNYRVRLKREIS
jgi:signal peptidase II